MTFKIPEPLATGLHCPKCNATNSSDVDHVWRVADENGLHYECTNCEATWD